MATEFVPPVDPRAPLAATDAAVVIVGAGHAGSAAAASLRRHGFDGRIVLLSDEAHPPYERPPLSKKLFAGRAHPPLFPEGFYQERNIDLQLGAPVASVDRSARRVRLVDGEDIDYDVLILATGARARSLAVPGSDLKGVRTLRNREDASLLEEHVAPGSRIAIIGGGWIGLEVAAAAIAAGHRVTVIEREERLLARVASPQLSQLLAGLHQEHGTEILTSAGVVKLEDDGAGAVAAVLLDNGRRVDCDHALIAVGAVPNIELARDAGLPCDGGIIVDRFGRTEDRRVYAVGDVSRRPLDLREGLFRLESIPSALEQVRCAVASILGLEDSSHEAPRFWSDQFESKIQIVGLLPSTSVDVEAVVCGDPGKGPVALLHLGPDRLLCAEILDSPAAFKLAQDMIDTPGAFDRERLSRAVQSDSSIEPSDAAGSLHGGKPRRLRPTVTFCVEGGRAIDLEVDPGQTLMEVAYRAKVPGILAECGGSMSCGTCHVLIAEEKLDLLGNPSQAESDMLEFVDGSMANSRLSCQLVMDERLDGLVLTVPPERP